MYRVGRFHKKTAESMEDSNPLPVPKKPVRFTGAALRIMQSCEKAYAANNFLLLYFTNKKTFTPQFSEFSFKELLRNKFQFLQLSRVDKAGNWITTSFHFKKSPYYVLIDPSNGQFVDIHYGDMTIPELKIWLQQFLAKDPKFAQATSIFPALIEETHITKKKTSYSYGPKLRVNFSCSEFDEKIIYVNKVAPLEHAFEKYCLDRKIDIRNYYFMFRGVEMPFDMTASHFGLKNGSVIHVHPLEDKVSVENITISVLGVGGEPSQHTVQKGRKINQFLRNYCERNNLNFAQCRFTHNNEMVNEDLTFAEHRIKNGDQICTHMKQYLPPPNEFMYHMMVQGSEVPSVPAVPSVPPVAIPGLGAVPPMQQAEQYEVPVGNPNLLYMYNAVQRPAPHQLYNPQSFTPQQFQMAPPPQAKALHAPYQKPHDANPTSIWESFDLSAMP